MSRPNKCSIPCLQSTKNENAYGQVFQLFIFTVKVCLSMFKCRLVFLIFSYFLFAAKFFSQEYTQTIRGTVADKVLQTPLQGAVVTLLNSVPLKNTYTDGDGGFKLKAVPIGKQSLRVSLVGYKDAVISNIIVNSGKEVVLSLNLEENVLQMKEVEVSGTIEKNKPLNEMALISSRTFSVEETQKYAASVNDPARMALSYTGVIPVAADNRNDISIRGNSPNGLLWRMEGIDIPNPNHYSYVGSAGGAISILSSQLLTNSDFITGAFPAEYGNALSGVFDLKLRKGNNEKNEFTAQVGVIGIDLSAEGPFRKGYAGSYLLNYRYSTVSLLSKIGIPFGTALDIFQDLSFNIWLPTNKCGNFSVFGLGGLSSEVANAKKDFTQWEYSYDNQNSTFFSNTGVVGITHTKVLNSRSFIKTALAASETGNGNRIETLDISYTPTLQSDESYLQKKVTLSSTLNYKFNPKLNLRSGIIINRIGFSLIKNELNTSTNIFQELLNTNGSSYTVQTFMQINYRITDKLTLNTGLHYFQFLLNNSNSLEPRASLRYDFSRIQSVSFGYGLHSQLQPMGVYFAEVISATGSIENPNRNLELNKSHHFVLAYERAINERTRLKIETYDQELFNIPVSPYVSNTFSLLNLQNGYVTDPLVNDGTGRNYGLELTLEQFLSKNFYFLVSASVFDSKYRAEDGIWRNTLYNSNYNFSITAGKEITMSERFKKRIIGFNIRALYIGGFMRTPIDFAQSMQQNQIVYVDSKAYSVKDPDFFRLDLRISLKRNYSKLTSIISFDVQNATNYKNVGKIYIDPVSGTIKRDYQLPLIPLLSYRIEF